jgi:hypothetical protein
MHTHPDAISRDIGGAHCCYSRQCARPDELAYLRDTLARRIRDKKLSAVEGCTRPSPASRP